MKAVLYDQKGAKKGEVTLPKALFEVEPNEGLIHRALVRQLANKRVDTASSKGRSDVRGGGRKPFRQKGTGNARMGTRRSPLARGGGIIFGPNGARNYKKDMPKKQRRMALFGALSAKAKDGKIMALDKYEAKAPKTKEFQALVDKLPVERNLLVVVDEKHETLQKSANNIPNVKTILVNYLNPHDLLKYRQVLFLEKALEKAEEVFTTKSK